MDNLQIAALVTIFLIGMVCFFELMGLKRNFKISIKILVILSFTGTLSFIAQIFIILNLSTSQVASFMLTGMSGSELWFLCTILACAAFFFISALTRVNWLDKRTFAALALVGQVTYPLFLFGMLIGQGGQ